MYQLNDLALNLILKEFHPQEYDPPRTDVQKWANSIESLCDIYGVPDIQRPECTVRFIRDELRAGARKVLEDVRKDRGSMRWDQFRDFMIKFDGEWDSTTTERPLT